jgi:hypothetical protein
VKQQKKVEDSERAMAEYREANNALSLIPLCKRCVNGRAIFSASA